MEINSDFKDLLREFAAAAVNYLIVGAHAVAYYGRPRATADFDVWVDRSLENAQRVHEALRAFGAPLEALSLSDLCGDDTVFQIGIAPVRIDVITGLTGLDFSEAWPRRSKGSIDGLEVFFIGRDDLIANKRATARHKDLADIESLLSDDPG